MNQILNRRDLLRSAAAALTALSVEEAARSGSGTKPLGCVAGHPEGAQAGLALLTAGGNAVDAAVAAALVASVVAVPMCGPGGFGGHMVIARAAAKRVVAIDFNGAAPQAARADMFPLDAQGRVKGQINQHGWLAAGVPGTLAGLQLALDRHGKLPFRQVVQPALHFAREGFEINAAHAAATRSVRSRLARDPATAQLLVPRGVPLQAGRRFRNPDLAALLETLARRNSVASFYQGDIARRIAAAFQEHGGLVTAEDLAAYQAREVEPLELSWHGYSIRTAPLTAGGATILEALAVLRELDWDKQDPKDPLTTHMLVEALRIAWIDRLTLLGDPEKVQVPLKRLLSADYGRKVAARVREAVRRGRMIPAATDGRPAQGTIHISAADAAGNLVALTLTHGESFGAGVTVDGLGLILGQGMSRFDPRPGRPNSPGPGKRPLHNMCPTIVLKDGKPTLALGGRGGRRIPNAVFAVLTAYVGRQASLEEAVAAPRLHTEGGRNLTLEKSWRQPDADYLRKIGYQVDLGPSAVVHAVAFDPGSGTFRAAGR